MSFDWQTQISATDVYVTSTAQAYVPDVPGHKVALADPPAASATIYFSNDDANNLVDAIVALSSGALALSGALSGNLSSALSAATEFSAAFSQTITDLSSAFSSTASGVYTEIADLSSALSQTITDVSSAFSSTISGVLTEIADVSSAFSATIAVISGAVFHTSGTGSWPLVPGYADLYYSGTGPAWPSVNLGVGWASWSQWVDSMSDPANSVVPDPGTGKLTLQTPGIYRVHAQASWAIDGGQDVFMTVFQNGAPNPKLTARQSAGGVQMIAVGGLVSASVPDNELEMQFRVSSATANFTAYFIEFDAVRIA